MESEMEEMKGLKYSSSEPRTPPHQESQSKGTASNDGVDHSNEKLTRKRAAKACLSCRSRKVRCSVSDHGIPCYNCKLDELQCVIPERKRPTRMAKRQKTIGAVISEAALNMDNSYSDNGNSPPSDTSHSKEFTMEDDWDARRNSHCINSPPMTESPPSISESDNHDISGDTHKPYGDQDDHRIDLPPCDEELARWFGVMPPRVVNKMFEYLTSLNHHGQPGQIAARRRRTKQKHNDKVRLYPSNDSSNVEEKWRSINPDTQDQLRCRILPRAPSFPQRHSEPLSPKSQKENPYPMVQSGNEETNLALLHQLHNSYGAARNTINTLAATIRRVDDQISRNRDLTSFPMSNQYPMGNNNGQTGNSTTTTNTAGNSNIYSKNIYTLQQPEKFLASPSSSSQKHEGEPRNTKHDTRIKMDEMNDVNLSENVVGSTGGKEDDFQEAFDSLIDFGEGETIFQPLDFDVA